MMTKSNRLTITELEQIRQRAEAATEGLWKYTGMEYGSYANEGFDICISAEGMDELARLDDVFNRNLRNDAEFIANARQDVPRLLTEVETLITEKARARRMLDELIGEMANADGAGYALAAETVRADLEKIRKELIDHGE